MYIVPSLDSDLNHRGGGQLPSPNECNSTLTSGTSGGIMSFFGSEVSLPRAKQE